MDRENMMTGGEMYRVKRRRSCKNIKIRGVENRVHETNPEMTTENFLIKLRKNTVQNKCMSFSRQRDTTKEQTNIVQTHNMKQTQ